MASEEIRSIRGSSRQTAWEAIPSPLPVKPHSLKADLELVSETLSQALDGRQIQPVLLQRPLSPH